MHPNYIGLLLVSTAWRVSYLDLHVTVDPTAQQLSGSVTLTAWAPPQPTALVLDLADSMIVDSATILSPVRPTTVARSEGHITIGPTETVDHCAPCRVQLWYHGSPNRRAVGFSQAPQMRVASYGLPNSAREWWPTIDDPSDKADSADITVTIPAALTAVSNGRLVGRTVDRDGQASTHWAVRSPIYPDVISFAVGDYTEHTGWFDSRAGKRVLLDFFVFPEDTAKAAEDFNVVPAILRFDEEWLGPYPYVNEKYGLAEFERRSFREHQTITSLGAAFLTGHHDADEVIAHEVAHQWFGNAITVQSWRDIWLNESFAEYMAWQWMRTAHGDSAFEALIADAIKTAPPGALARADSGGFKTMFGALTFGKGPVVLVMLDELIGHDPMRRALRAYADARHASAAAFAHDCERASGMRLDWFMRQWVDGAVIPTVRYRVDTSTTNRIRVTIDQQQPGPAFRLPLTVVIVDSAGAKTKHRVTISKQTNRFDFAAEGRPRAVRLEAPHQLVSIGA